MRRTSVLVGVVVVAVVGALGSPIPASAHQALAPPARPGSAHQGDPASGAHPDAHTLAVQDIDALAPDDVWAVGIYDESHHYATMAEHWDGSTWTFVPTPDPGAADNYLTSVSGAAADDVWAVGYSYAGNSKPEQLLAEHWDGTAWTVVPLEPPPAPQIDTPAKADLRGVTAIAPDDVWAVGDAYGQAVTEHWDGTAWSLVHVPRATGANLNDVAGVSGDDVWAVGQQPRHAPGTSGPLILHWNGASWSRPDAWSHSGAWLTGVAPVASDDAWAVGTTFANGVISQVLLRWDGQAWHRTHASRVPDLASGSLAATSPDDVWLISTLAHRGQADCVVQHWDGSSWSRVDLPAALADKVSQTISADAGDDAWLANLSWSRRTGNTIGRWDGTDWSVVPA